MTRLDARIRRAARTPPAAHPPRPAAVPRRRRTAPLAVAVSAALALALAGCVDAARGPGTSATPFRGQIPEFSGPWAAEFADAYVSTLSDDAREVLAREDITEFELAQFRQRYGACMEAEGIDYHGFAEDGSHGYTFPDHMSFERADEILDGCAADTGLRELGRLYRSIGMNPNNEDLGEITLACLRSWNVVPPGYSLSEWRRDYETHSIPTDGSAEAQGILDRCEADPIGATRAENSAPPPSARHHAHVFTTTTALSS